MYFIHKSTLTIIQELNGWESLTDFKNALDRTGSLSERQLWIDSLSESDIAYITADQYEAILYKKNRISELKSLLASTDFEMTVDRYNKRTTEQNEVIESQREAWRIEMRQLLEEIDQCQ